MSWYDDLVAGRNPFGQVGFSIGDAISPWMANNAAALDPRLSGLGYRTNVSHQEGDVYSLEAPEGLDQQGYVMRDGKPYVQVSRQAAGLVKDPSQAIYDERYGALVPREAYDLKDSPIDSLMGNAIRGVAIAAPFAMIGGMVPGVEGVFGNGGLLGAGADGAAGPGWAQGGGFGAGAISPETAAGAGGMGSGAAAGAAGALDTYMGGAAGAAGAGSAGGLPAWLSGLATPSGLLQAGGALYSASGLLGGGNNSGSQPSGGPSNVGLLNPQAFQRPEWKPNAHTLAQLNQLYGGIYGG